MRQYEEPFVLGHLLLVEVDLLQEAGADGAQQQAQHGAAEHRRRVPVHHRRADGGHVAVAHPSGTEARPDRGTELSDCCVREAAPTQTTKDITSDTHRELMTNRCFP